MTVNKAIDPGRIGLSKSLMTSPCERKGYYSETVRDAKGRRLSFPMPERVIFGKAIDVAHSYIVWHEREGREWSLAEAIHEGLRAARADELSWPAIEPRSNYFDEAVERAMQQFVRVPDGLARLKPLIESVHIQGDEGESLRADDIIGTPDYWWPDTGSVLDVKASDKKYTPAKFYVSPEMGLYAFLSAEMTGFIPERLIYQVYVRTSAPYWMWIEEPGTVELVNLGHQNAKHWRAVMAAGNPDLLSSNTIFCSDCGFRDAMPELGYEGCPVGLLVPRGEAA